MRIKTALWVLGAWCVAWGPQTLAAAPSSQSSDELQNWIAANAVAVRSIDAADEDFSDLEPLIDAIGPARVVQLGEPSHGAGSGFAAKARLVKFLHQRMGFDVLVWESGMYDVRLTQAGMRGSQEAVAAAQQGILKIWSAAEEVRPLFEYAKASQAGTRPLDMAGFDMQVTGEKSLERLAADLRAFVRVLSDPALRRRASGLADQTIAASERLHAYSQARMRMRTEASKAGQSGKALADTLEAWETREGSRLRPQKQHLESLRQAVDGLLAIIGNHRAAFGRVHGNTEITFMERVLDNLRSNGATVYGIYGPDRPNGSTGYVPSVEVENRRDAGNADNLRWLIQQGYPGRKIIVWAHNAHLMNAYYADDWRTVRLEPQPRSMKPTGVFLAEWLKDDVYTIALTAYQGEDGWGTTGTVNTIAPAVEGSLESRLHKLGKPYAFLDFRALDGSPGHPLHAPQSLRIPKYDDNDLPDITKAIDAVFYIDRMAPATRIKRDGGG